jgi:hypothetical protein
MKYIVAFLFAGALATGCDESAGIREKSAEPKKSASANAAEKSSDQLTTIQWIDSVRNYGKINDGQVLEVSFRFKNTGDKPLVIENVQPECGCTAPEWSKEPVMPGQEGVINAKFNSSGKAGMASKNITITANTKGSKSHVVHFDVEVLAKKTQ